MMDIQAQETTTASAEAMVHLRRRSWTTEGLHDAFVFALSCQGDVAQIRAKIAENEEFVNHPSPALVGPMSSGAGPRIYTDGYLAGLREALEIIARHTDASTEYEPSQASQERERSLAENANTAYRADGEDESASPGHIVTHDT